MRKRWTGITCDTRSMLYVDLWNVKMCRMSELASMQLQYLYRESLPWIAPANPKVKISLQARRKQRVANTHGWLPLRNKCTRPRQPEAATRASICDS